MIQVNFKKNHNDAVMPSYAKPGDAGMDLTAVSVEYDKEDDVIVYDTGISIEIPNGYVGMVYTRSSIASKDLTLSNHVGIIDSGYRGTIKAKFRIPQDYHKCGVDLDEFNDNLNSGLFTVYASESDFADDLVVDYKVYAVNDRICQLIIIPYPQVCFNQVDELSSTERGAGGYGHTGN